MSVFSFISGIDSSVGIFNITSLSLGSLNRHCYSYNPSLLDVFETIDFGGLSLAPTTTINNGQVADLNATQVEYGRVVHGGNLESFGFFKTLNAASWKATNTYEGRGIAFTFGKQTAPAVYGYIVDGKVKGLNLSLSGTITEVFSPKHDGVGSTSVLGQSPIGIGVGVFGSGTLFTIASTDDAFVSIWTSSGYISKVTGAARDITLVHETGFGNLFTFSGGQQRATNAFAGSGGFKLVSRKPELLELSDEKHTNSYVNDAIVYFEKYDHGYLSICDPASSEILSGIISGQSTECAINVAPGTTATVDLNATYQVSLGSHQPTSSIDYGLISEPAAPQVDFGEILTTSNLIPFGLFTFDPHNGAADKFLPTWTSRGYISKLTGEASVPLDVSVFGSGIIKALGGDSITNFSLLQPGDGLFGFHSESQIGISVGIFGDGFIPTLSGVADSVTFNPDEKDLLFSLTGEAEIAFNPNWIGSGILFTLQTAVERTVYDYIGSGRIFGFNNLEEKKVYDYNCSSIVAFPESDYGFIINTGAITCIDVDGVISTNETTTSGCIKVLNSLTVDQGVTYSVRPQNTIASNILDYGLTSENAAPIADFGDILGTPRLGLPGCIYGHIDITGESVSNFAPNWISRGYISKLTGEARVPLDVTVFGSGTIRKFGGDSITNFSLLQPGDGLFGFHSESQIGISVGIFGDGFIPTLSGAADSVTFNPDERDLLFSFTGEATFTYNPNWIGSGVLFTLQTAVEKTVYDYVGSGRIFGFNNLEEKKVYDYNCSSIVPFPENDYGFIINTGAIACVDVDGVISTSETTTSGCIKVLNTLTIDPGVTYSVRPQNTIASNILDYGLVPLPASPLADFGDILDTPRQGLPGCIYGEIEISGSVTSKLQPTYIAEGYISKLTGEATVPLDVTIPIFGTIGTLHGESVPNFSLLHPGGGQLARIHGTLANFNFTLGWHGSGTIPKLGGAADSVTFNPDERDLLFSFTGEATFAFNLNWIGSGVLFTLQTAVERTVYDYAGSGGLFGFNNLEEVKVYSYNCSSIAPFTEPDYGFIIDPNAVSCVDVGGVISTDTTSTTGCTKVLNSLAVDPGVTYTITPQYTVPSSTLDYGFVAENASPLVDHGHILGTSRQGLPACIYGQIDIFGVGDVAFAPSYYGHGLFRVSGKTDESYSFAPYIGSGTIKVGGDSKTNFSLLQPGDGLFGFRSESQIGIGIGIIGEGILFGYTGTAESISTIPPTEQPIFTFVGTSGDPGICISTEGDGNLFGIGGGELLRLHAYHGSGRLFGFNSKEEARTYAYDGGICRDIPDYDYGFLQGVCLNIEIIQGNVTGTTQACIVKVEPGTTASIDNTYRIETNAIGSATEFYDYDLIPEPPDGLHDYGHILGRTGVLCPAYLFRFRRGALSDFDTFDWQQSFVGSGTLLVSGESTNSYTPNFNGSGTLRKFTGAVESFTLTLPEQYGLFRVSGITGESYSLAPYIGSGDLFTFNNLAERVSADYVGSGVFVVSGESTNKYTPNFNGSGTLRKFTGTAESFTLTLPEQYGLFRVSGITGESYSPAPHIGSGYISFNNYGFTTSVFFIPNYPGEGYIPLTGIADTRYIPNHHGSGTLRKFTGTAESFTVNPEEKQLLFSFTGGITSEKHTEVYVGIEKPIKITRGILSDWDTYDWQPCWVSKGGITIRREEAKTHWIPDIVGTGRIPTLSGSAESLTVNPEERQMLFSFTGTRIAETTSIAEFSTGTLFGIGGISESFTASPELQADLIISGDVFIRYVPNNIGSGNIFAINGVAESVTFNPDERQMLFSFIGEASESFSATEIKQIEVDITGEGQENLTSAYTGSGSAQISGVVTEKFVPNNIGSGNIFALAGSAESITFNPDEKQMLFSFTGEGTERILVREISQGGTFTFSGTSGEPLLTFAEQPFVQTKISGKAFFTTHRSIVGIGSLYTIGGSAEAVGFNPEEREITFKVVGDSSSRITSNWIGSGSLRKLGGSAESVSYNPDEKQMLFSFTGEGTEKRVAREIGTGTLPTTGEAGVLVRFAHTGEGTIPLSGNAHTTRARDFVGFGIIPTLSGAAESLTFNPTERDMLFSFIGERISEKTTATEFGIPGEFTIQGTSGDPLLTFAEQPFVKIDVAGVSYVITTNSYNGSGRLFGFNNGDEAYSPAPYVTSGTISLSGRAFVQVNLFQAPHVQIWII